MPLVPKEEEAAPMEEAPQVKASPVKASPVKAAPVSQAYVPPVQVTMIYVLTETTFLIKYRTKTAKMFEFLL